MRRLLVAIVPGILIASPWPERFLFANLRGAHLFYPFREIHRAVADAKRGKTIKPVLRMDDA